MPMMKEVEESRRTYTKYCKGGTRTIAADIGQTRGGRTVEHSSYSTEVEDPFCKVFVSAVRMVRKDPVSGFQYQMVVKAGEGLYLGPVCTMTISSLPSLVLLQGASHRQRAAARMRCCCCCCPLRSSFEGPTTPGRSQSPRRPPWSSRRSNGHCFLPRRYLKN